MNQTIRDRLRGDSRIDPNIRRILEQYQIADKGWEFIDQSKPGYPGGDAQVNTLRVFVDVDDHVSTINWSKARRELSKMLHEHGFDMIIVEILDDVRTNILRISPISPEDPVVTIYESFRWKLVEEITRSLGKCWTTLCLFSVQRPSQEQTFAVVITIQPYTVCDWLVLRSKLQHIIHLEFEAKRIAQPSSSIDIEFTPGGWSMLEPDTSRPGIGFARDAVEHPKLGTSISVKEEQGGGTLGGFFKLKCGSTTHRGFLTNHHVVAPPKSAPQSVKEQSSLRGTLYRPNIEIDATRTNIQFFANKDIAASIVQSNKLTSEANEKIDDKKAEISRREEYGLEPDERIDGALARLVEAKRRQGLQRAKLDKLPITLGKVLVSSGRGWNASKRIIDWAFVELIPTQENIDIWNSPSKNRLPREDAAGLFKHLPGDYVPKTGEYLPGDPPGTVRGFSRLQKGQWYFKVGRTTAITAGICHGTTIILRTSGTEEVTGSRSQYDSSGKFCGLSKPVDFIEELIIVNSRNNGGFLEQDEFCQLGDSGALIIDTEGYAAGLLFASYSGNNGPLNPEQGLCFAAGIAMTMPDVLESIGTRTTPRDASGNPTGPPGRLLLPETVS